MHQAPLVHKNMTVAPPAYLMQHFVNGKNNQARWQQHPLQHKAHG
jgi:hypothetical protein